MAGITEDIFVGASRTQTSQTLSAIWDEVVASGTNRLVVVQGPPGSGRRAVARALYKHGAIHQEGLPYWPHAFGVGNDTMHKGLSTESLGMLNPSQDNAQMPDVGTAAKVEYLWWALHAIPGKCAAVEAERYLHRHAIPIARAVQTAKDLPMARIRALIEVSCLLSSVVALMDLAIAAPTGVLETEVDWPGVGPGLLGPLKDAPAAGNAFQAALQSRKSVLQKGLEQDAMASLTPGARQEALEAARNSGRLFSLVSEEVPSVIVVDEAEQLDAATAQMLKTIARDSAHQGLMVLLRTTDDAGHPLSALEADVETWWEEDARMGRLTTLALDPLSTDEMIEIALHDLRAADRDQLDKQNLAVVLEASQGRPGFLRHYLTQPAVQEAVIGNGTLTDLRRVPLTKRFDPYTEEAFTVLPELAQKQALAALSLLGPATPSAWLATEPADITPSSVGPLLTGEKLTAAATTGWTAEDRLSEALRFRSQRAHASAFAHIPAQLTPERQHQVLTAATAHIMAARTTGAWKEIIDPVRESVLAALHSQQNSETGFELEADLEAEMMQMKRLTARPAADETTLAALDERLRTGTSSVRLRVSVAQAMLEAGHTERSLAVLREELDRVTAKWGKDVPQTFPALTNLATAWAVLARRHVGHPEARSYFDTAIDLYQRLLTARLRHNPAGDNRIFKTRRTLARLLAEDHRYREAINQLQICLREMEDHPGYGPDHYDTLVTRGNLATWIAEAGDPATARDLGNALLMDMERVLGPGHPDSLTIRNNVATWTGDAGNPSQARALLTALLPERERLTGPDHLETLKIRHNLATWSGQAGDPTSARDLCAALIPDMQRVLGPDHPNTLGIRNNLVDWTGKAGDPVTARDLSAILISDMQRALGSDHPNTLRARNALARWTGEAGDPAAARDLFAALIPDMRRALGSNHPDTMSTRHNLAFWTGEAGDPAAARDMFVALLSDRESAVGPKQPEVLSTRSNLATWTGEAGDPAAALDLFASLIPDMEEVLSPGHPQTFHARRNFALWAGRAGDPAAARDMLAALIPDLERVLSPKHPDTLSARNNLARWTGEAGDPAAARDLFASLIPDMEEVLSPDHRGTLITRSNLASWTREAGDPAAARDMLAALIPDLERVLSPDHPELLKNKLNLANWTGTAGDPAAARDMLAALIPDLERVLSPDHPELLKNKLNLANWTGAAGDPEVARELLAALLPDQERVMGPDHTDTLLIHAFLKHHKSENGGN